MGLSCESQENKQWVSGCATPAGICGAWLQFSAAELLQWKRNLKYYQFRRKHTQRMSFKCSHGAKALCWSPRMCRTRGVCSSHPPCGTTRCLQILKDTWALLSGAHRLTRQRTKVTLRTGSKTYSLTNLPDLQNTLGIFALFLFLMVLTHGFYFYF